MDLKECIVVDINSIPQGMDWDVWLMLVNEQNIILWDSMKRPEQGNIPVEPKPYMVEHNYRIVDIRQLSTDERDEYFKSLNIDL